MGTFFEVQSNHYYHHTYLYFLLSFHFYFTRLISIYIYIAYVLSIYILIIFFFFLNKKTRKFESMTKKRREKNVVFKKQETTTTTMTISRNILFQYINYILTIKIFFFNLSVTKKGRNLSLQKTICDDNYFFSI